MLSKLELVHLYLQELSGSRLKKKAKISFNIILLNLAGRIIAIFLLIDLFLVSSWWWMFDRYCVTQLMLYTGDKLSSSIFCCLWVCQASVSPDQISTFSNIYRHTSPLLTMYHLIWSSTKLYWPSTSQYRNILTQYHQVPLITHHLMSHAQYTWSSYLQCFVFLSFLS